MQDPAETLVPLAAIFIIFGLPLTYAIVSRVLAHQERLEYIKRGIAPPPDPKWAKRMAKAGWYDPSTYGMPQGAPQPQAYGPYAGWNNPASTLRKGITLAMCGMALLIGLSFISPGHFGPWLLGGLIPLFVGIAQVIIAVLSGASLGPAGPQQWGPGPQQSQQQPPGQQPFVGPKDVTPGGYAGWRPGSMTGLEKPPSPPDTR